MKILGIETSCDETAAAIVDNEKNILSNCLNSQIKLHQEYGGVVPELAARSHIDFIDDIILQTLQDAKISINEIDAIAATAGPGLIGGLIVGLVYGKTLSSVLKKPFIAVNHLEAHILTPKLTNNLEFPYLALLLSGGHCQIIYVKSLGKYYKIGQTIDDALGETFDKVAQMMGLDYPGGPKIEELAKSGDENRFKFPRPLIDNNLKNHIFDFSFSGLKTAVRREIEKIIQQDFSHQIAKEKLDDTTKKDICASFQKTIVKILINRLDNIFQYFEFDEKPRNIAICGGVAANKYIFNALNNWALQKNKNIIAPPIKLCTDNGAMIAFTGALRLKNGLTNSLDFKPLAKWELDNIDC